MTDDKFAGTARRLIAQGKIIEAGWVGLRAVWLPADAPPHQVDDCRSAFFAGAQHLFASIMVGLDEGLDPTDADMDRMSAISTELAAFFVDFQRRHLPTEGRA
jgi:hypothetical protein